MAASRPRFGYHRNQLSNDLKENKYLNRRKLNAHLAVPEEPEVQEVHVVSPRLRLQRVRNFRETKVDFKKVEIPMKKFPLKRTIPVIGRPPLSEENGVKTEKSVTKIPKPKAAFIPKGPPVVKKPLKENNRPPPVKGKKVSSLNVKGHKPNNTWSPGFPSDISSIEPASANTSFAPEGYAFSGIENLSQFDFVCEDDESSISKSVQKISTPIKGKLLTSVASTKENLKDPKPRIKPIMPWANTRTASNAVKTQFEPTKLKVPTTKKPLGAYSNTKLKSSTSVKESKVKEQMKHEVSKVGARLVHSKTKLGTSLSKVQKIERLNGNRSSNKIQLYKSKSDLSLNSASSNERSGKLGIKTKVKKSNDNVAKAGKHLDFKKSIDPKKLSEEPPEKAASTVSLDKEINNECVTISIEKAPEDDSSAKISTDEVRSRERIFSRSFSEVSLIENEQFPHVPIDLDDLDTSLYMSPSPPICNSIMSKVSKTPFDKCKTPMESFCSKFKELHIQSETKSNSLIFEFPSTDCSRLSDVFEASESSNFTKWQTAFDSFHLGNSTTVENGVSTEKDDVNLNNMVSSIKGELLMKDLMLNEVGCASQINSNLINLEEKLLFHDNTSLSVIGQTINELSEVDENTDKSKTISEVGKVAEGVANRSEIINSYGGLNIISEEIIQTNSNFDVVDGASNTKAVNGVSLIDITNSDHDTCRPNTETITNVLDCDSHYYELVNALVISETIPNIIDVSSIVNVVNPEVTEGNSLCSISLLGSPPVSNTPVTSLPDNLMCFSPSV